MITAILVEALLMFLGALFSPNPSQLIIHLSLYHSTLYKWDTADIVK
jgi:hypothetical protein